MVHGNSTSDFILLEFFDHTTAQQFLFGIVLEIMISLAFGNALMVLLVHQDLRLHTPVYFLLSKLSLMDLMLVCTMVQWAVGCRSSSP